LVSSLCHTRSLHDVLPILLATFTFTPEVTWASTLQWDDRSERFGVFSRVRWIFRPGNELFVIFNESLAEDDGGLTSELSELAFKDRKSTRLNSSHVKISYA